MKVFGKGSFIQMLAEDRGIIDRIIVALTVLSKENMISYDKEIEWLIELKKL